MFQMTNSILLASAPVCVAFLFLATGIVTGKWDKRDAPHGKPKGI
jgi:hypothetical protein